MSLTIEQTRELVSSIKNRIEKARKDEEQMIASLKIVQNLCDHDYKEVGHDHNYVYYKCSICGNNIRV
jgi:hypothetical protein